MFISLSSTLSGTDNKGVLRYVKGREQRQQEKAVRPGSAGDKGGPNDWKALAPVALDSAAVGVVRWSATGGVLGAIGLGMANGAHVLAETVLHRQLRYRHQA